MRTTGWLLRTAVVLLSCSFAACAELEWLTAAKDGTGFVGEASGKKFVPWGFNYDRDYKSRLLDEYWETEWETVAADLAEMKELGANVVRIHLQVAKFMDGPDKPNRAALERLKRLVAQAEKTGLYLDVTGLACYRKQAVPQWYTDAGETQRWETQGRFWEAIAECCADSDAPPVGSLSSRCTAS
jgi:aryl-phospho-beta-D-glucosidase BglC (GH1 family)